jgi:hypothetical protein
MADPVVPAGSRFYAWRPVIRGIRTNASFVRKVSFSIRENGGLGNDYKILNIIQLNGNSNTYYGQWQYGLTGTPRLATQSDANNFQLYMAGFGGAGADVRIEDVWIEIQYDQQPTTTIIAPTGTVSDNPNPIIRWSYTDPDGLSSQDHYQVQIYAGASLTWDSGEVASADTQVQVPTGTLADNTAYTFWVRTSQQWTGATEQPAVNFWSPWNTTGSFTMASVPYAIPKLTAIASGDHATITVQHGQNLLSAYDAQLNGGVSEWTPSAGVNLAPSSSIFHSAPYSMNVTLPSSGSGQIVNKTFHSPVTPGQAYYASMYVRQAPAASAVNVELAVIWYDATGAALATSGGGAVAENGGATWKLVTASVTAPALAAWAHMEILFTSAAASLVHYVDDIQFTPKSGSFATPDDGGRGGALYYQQNLWDGFAAAHPSFVLQGTNLIDASNSDFEDLGGQWKADSNSTAVVTGTSKTGWPGSQALLITRTASGSGVVVANWPVGGYLPCNPNEQYALAASLRIENGTPATIGGQCQFITKFYDSNLTLLASGGIRRGGTTAWNDMSSGYMTFSSDASGIYTVAPIGTAFMNFELQTYVATAQFESMYFDRLSVVKRAATGGLSLQSWQQGLPRIGENGIAYIDIEYMEPGNTIDASWHTLASLPIDPLSPTVSFVDYDMASGVARSYRSRARRTLGGIEFTSAYSNSAGAVVTLTGVWLSDPVSGTYNFVYVQKGKNEQRGVVKSLTQFEGRQFPNIQIGTARTRSIDVILELPTSADRVAWAAYETYPGQVTYRDGRGRRCRGSIDNVQLSDADYGGQTASFTLTVAGDQSIQEQL